MKQPPIIVSACLAGMFCRYNGEAHGDPRVEDMVRRGEAVPFCPEAMGGLHTPRNPCEIRDDRVFDTEGKDCTEQFERGAAEGLRLARMYGCTEAVLKARSPSCGSGVIYDGSFTSTRIKGDGVFANLLKKHGFTVRTEEDLD